MEAENPSKYVGTTKSVVYYMNFNGVIANVDCPCNYLRTIEDMFLQKGLAILKFLRIHHEQFGGLAEALPTLSLITQVMIGGNVPELPLHQFLQTINNEKIIVSTTMRLLNMENQNFYYTKKVKNLLELDSVLLLTQEGFGPSKYKKLIKSLHTFGVEGIFDYPIGKSNLSISTGDLKQLKKELDSIAA